MIYTKAIIGGTVHEAVPWECADDFICGLSSIGSYTEDDYIQVYDRHMEIIGTIKADGDGGWKVSDVPWADEEV